MSLSLGLLASLGLLVARRPCSIWQTLRFAFTTIGFLEQLFSREINSLLACREKGKQEGKRGLSEEPLLGLLAIFVHGVANCGEVADLARLLEQAGDLLLLEMVRQNDLKDRAEELIGFILGQPQLQLS